MDSFQAGWYVMYTMPRHERKVAQMLNHLNIKSFFPTQRVLRFWNKRRKFINVPLFPSYIFLYLTDLNSYYDSMKLEGYLYYVKIGRKIAKVNESTINEIKLITENLSEIETYSRVLEKGRKIFIKEGPLTGVCCEVIEMHNKNKVIIRLELLQRTLLATLPVEYLIVS